MIYVLVAVHDRAELTKRFFEQLQKQTYQDKLHIVLVDDGSTDDTVAITKELFPTAKIISSDGSWWWSHSMYQGCKYILEHAKPEDYVLMANNDQLPDPNAIEQLLETSKKYDDAIVGTISRKYDEPETIYNTAQTINWFNYSYQPIPYNKSESEYTGNIDVLTCRLTLVPVFTLQEVQFDPRFTQYYGDYDLFLNLKKHGYKLVVSYTARLYDLGGPSGLKRNEKPSVEEIYKALSNENSHSNLKHTAYFIWKNCPSKLWSIILILLFCGVHIIRLIKAIITLKFRG